MSANGDTDNDATNGNRRSDTTPVAQAVLLGVGPIFSREDMDRVVREAERRGEEREKMKNQEHVREAERRGEEIAENRMKRKIQEHAECTICLKIPRADKELQQCPNGHLTCETCMANCGDSCPTCRLPLYHGPRSRKIRIRALAIDNIIDAVDLERECKYGSCDFAASKQTLDRHAKICTQRTVPCPGFECGACPTFSDLMEHVNQRHPETKFGTISQGSTYKRRYETCALDLVDDGGWEDSCMHIRTYRGMQFVPCFAVVNRVCYAWMYILGHCEEAEMFQVTMYIGERQQSAIAHHGKVFPIDTEKEVIMRQKSGVLSFSLNGMGSSFFRLVPSGRGEDRNRQITVYFSIVESQEPHHLGGLHQFCREGEGEPSSADEDASEDEASIASSPTSTRTNSPGPP